jgi:Uma2 family endonuclease
MHMALPTYWTADMVRALPEDRNKYEVVHGELLVTPAARPWHEVLVTRLIADLSQYLRREPVGVVLGSRGDISWDAATLVQPDVFVVTVPELRTLEWKKIQHLLLVAEVLSPSSLKSDRFLKRRRYQEAGVPLYWIVDGDEHQVEVWTPGDTLPTVERHHLHWHPDGAGSAFTLELAELFRPL